MLARLSRPGVVGHDPFGLGTSHVDADPVHPRRAVDRFPVPDAPHAASVPDDPQAAILQAALIARPMPSHLP